MAFYEQFFALPSMHQCGRVNPHFVFGWPPDWIGTVDPASPDWTWQSETWSVPTVGEVLQTRHEVMYRVINEKVGDIDDAAFERVTAADGKVRIAHDPRLVAAMQANRCLWPPGIPQRAAAPSPL